MKFLIIVLLTVICIFMDPIKATQRGYLLVVPRELSRGARNEIKLDLFDIDGPGELTFRLLNTYNNSIFMDQTVITDSGVSKHVIDLEVPNTKEIHQARLQVSGKFKVNGEDDYEIFGEETVSFIDPPTKIAFIQTDKPIYKPGQKVQFRVLLVDSALKPLGGNTQMDIWVEEPSGARVAQWKNVSLGYGIVQRELQLSEEPILGKWKIVVFTDGLQESTYFQEKEYVLPKFEIIVKPPSFVLITEKTIPVEICGKYTYGKLVEGTVKIKVSLETYSWSYEKFPTLHYEGQIEGCYEYIINVTAVDEEFKHTYRRIEVYTEVNETGTGISRNATVYIERQNTPLYLKFETESRQYFKPGLPYHGTLKVTHPDNTAAVGEHVQICVTLSHSRLINDWSATKIIKHCRNYTSDENGVVSYTVPPQNTDVVSMNIEAKSLKYPDTPQFDGPTTFQPTTFNYLRPWYSPSGSHIQVQTKRGPLPCGQKTNIQVLFTAEKEGSYKFFYEVINDGKVFISDEIIAYFSRKDDISDLANDDVTRSEKIPLEPSASFLEKFGGTETITRDDDYSEFIADTKYIPMVGSVNINVDISAAESPSFHFLVYYMRDDREIVADSQKFSVDKCFNNKVTLEFQDEVKQPGEKTTLTLSSSPNSLCGIKVIDKSVTLLDNNEQLTKEKVFEALDRKGGSWYFPRNRCHDRVQPGLERKFASTSTIVPTPERPSYMYSSTYEDAITAFEDSELLIISDLILFTRPCEQPYHDYAVPRVPYSYSDVGRGGGGGEAFYTTSMGGGYSGHISPPGPAAQPDRSDSATKSIVDVRTFFPDTWLFDLIKVGENGKIIQKEKLPHTITEWLGSAVCINTEDGLGLSSETAHIKGFQAFFLSFTLPYSVIRGEKLPVIVTVFNYLDKCLPISLQLEQSDGFVLLSDSSEVEVCVCGGKSESKEFIIQPTILGTLNLTVSGRNAKRTDVCNDLETATVVAKDAVTNSLVVEAEGFPYVKVTNALFCPKDAENNIYTQTFSFELPENVVEDSDRGYLSVSGSVMGSSIQNLDRLVQLPTGCGEQNMVTFTPIISVLDYLHATGQLKDTIETKAKEYLTTGYQRELNYRHSDGSYSAFGSRDQTGSMWLTAFVLRSFAQAQKYIDIDANVQKTAVDWILSKQRLDGSFPEIGLTLSHGIKGGLNTSSTALTAYVLSSLLISGMESEKAAKLALSFLASKGDDGSDPYLAALYAYTFVLARNDVTAAIYLRKALDKAEITGEETRWRIKGSTENSLSVEIAAYAILTLLKLGEPSEKSLPIIRAITKARNNDGGFISTQDTVLGLEALSQFASLYSTDPIQLDISVSGDMTEKISFTEDDKILVKKYKTPQVPAQLSLKASGTGCGLIQATVLCNTLTVDKENYFALEIEAARLGDCKSANIKICTRYLPQGKRSNMAVVEMKMVSGIVPSEKSIQQLLSNKELEMKRYDVENNNIVFYFDELTNENKCWQFEVEELVRVGDVKPAIATVYDYYAIEQKQEATYTIEECT